MTQSVPTNPLTFAYLRKSKYNQDGGERALAICGYGQDVDKEEASESMVIGAIDICFVSSKTTKSKLTGRNHSHPRPIL